MLLHIELEDTHNPTQELHGRGRVGADLARVDRLRRKLHLNPVTFLNKTEIVLSCPASYVVRGNFGFRQTHNTPDNFNSIQAVMELD